MLNFFFCPRLSNRGDDKFCARRAGIVRIYICKWVFYIRKQPHACFIFRLLIIWSPVNINLKPFLSTFLFGDNGNIVAKLIYSKTSNTLFANTFPFIWLRWVRVRTFARRSYNHPLIPNVFKRHAVAIVLYSNNRVGFPSTDVLEDYIYILSIGIIANGKLSL